MFCETWKDEASLSYHSSTDAFKKYVGIIGECGEMKVEKFERWHRERLSLYSRLARQHDYGGLWVFVVLAVDAVSQNSVLLKLLWN